MKQWIDRVRRQRKRKGGGWGGRGGRGRFMDENHQLTTPTIDLLAPPNRFVSTSRLHGRFQRYRLVLRRYWWVVALILVSVAGPAYVYTADSPPSYRSKGRMWLTGRLNIG